MGIEVQVTGNGRYAGARSNVAAYEVGEDATPAEISDSSGATGQIAFTAIEDPSRFGSVLLLSDEVTLTDGDRGMTVGKISDLTSDNGVMRITADSRLGRLVVDKDAAPVHTTFTLAMTYYLGLAGITTGIAVDPTLGAMSVVAPAWSGDLWTKIKELCVAYGAEIALVRDVVTVRPIRQRRALEINNVEERWTVSNREMAKQIEVYNYNSVWRAGAMVYPKAGWSDDVPIYTVDAGQLLHLSITVGVSMTSVVSPTAFTNVPRYYAGPSSAYSVIGNNGLAVPAADWTAGGGRIEASVSADTKNLELDIFAPSSGPVLNYAPYRIAAVDAASGEYFSSLRVMGDGVHYEVTSLIAPTAADELYTSRDTGVTVDNVFIATQSQCSSLSLDAASRWAVPTRTIEISKSAINKPGETGQDYDYATFGDFDTYAPGAGITTFANFDTVWAGDTFGDFDDYWYSLVESDFNFQVFGNASGARIQWRRAMWRIRSVTITADNVDYTAEEDTTIGDFDTSATGMTFAQFDTSFAGLTFADFGLIPLPVVASQYDRF